jgi:hypothetical protein
VTDDHSPEAYRTLFGLIGAGMQATSLIFIAASALVAPFWVVAGLAVVWLTSTVWSWRGWARRTWLPLATGTAVAVLWIVALTVFA